MIIVPSNVGRDKTLAVGTVGVGATTIGGTSTSWSHVTESTDTDMFVGVAGYPGYDAAHINGSDSLWSLTSVKVDGVNLTFLGSDYRIGVFYGKIDGGGTKTISLSYAGGANIAANSLCFKNIGSLGTILYGNTTYYPTINTASAPVGGFVVFFTGVAYAQTAPTSSSTNATQKWWLSNSNSQVSGGAFTAAGTGNSINFNANTQNQNGDVIAIPVLALP